jgi:hypothetical protein
MSTSMLTLTTLASLPAQDPRFVDRQPGVQDIERLFPSPVTAGKGRMAVEGGVSVVGGPGMGKTSLFAQLASRLTADRRITTATVPFPDVSQYLGDEGFYAFLGALVLRIRGGLLQSQRVLEDTASPVAIALQPEPVWDVPGAQAMTPRGFERFIAHVAQSALHTPGICLLFDDVDQIATSTWKGPFISALRFVFQTSSGITPIYALWTLFGDESLPGSNYFRNVTRPVFLEPLARESAETETRAKLIAAVLPEISTDVRGAIGRLAGGHPLLLQRLLGDLSTVVPNAAERAKLTPQSLDQSFGTALVNEQQQLVLRLLGLSPGLAAALSSLRSKQLPYVSVPKGLVSSGFVDQNDQGIAVLAGRASEVIA